MPVQSLNTRSFMAQAGLDHHKEAALQHAVRSYAVAERMGARHDVPDPPSFARPAVEPQGPGGSDVAARPKARRVLLTSETRSLGWKPRVRLWQAACTDPCSCTPLHSLCIAAMLCWPAQVSPVPADHIQGQWGPHTDLFGPRQVTAVETERMYVVTLWLPGADARSLRINQTARRLTVSGSRGRAAGGQGAERFALGWDLPVRSAPHQHDQHALSCTSESMHAASNAAGRSMSPW